MGTQVRSEFPQLWRTASVRTGHDFDVPDPDSDETEWDGYTASPAWAEVDRIREEMLWSRLETALTASALGRVAAAVGWMTLALVTGASASWGIAMLVGGCLALVHARRSTVLLLADNAGVFSAAVRWLLPYPRVPHINPVGVIETSGVMIANAGTGWIGGAFAGTPGARAAESAALVLLVVYDLGVIINFTGHVSWELGPAAAFYSGIRPFLPPAMAVVCVGLLWPRPEMGVAYGPAVVTVVVGGMAILLGGWTSGWFLSSAAALMTQRFHGVRRAVQAVDGGYVHQLKNVARIVYRRSDEIAAGDLRERVRRLCVAISSTEQMFKSGRGQPARCVEEVVNGILGLDERFAALRNVEADLDPRDLTAGDAELVTIAVGDLCSNAVNAGASRFRVGLRAETAEHGSWLTLEAECVCGKSMPEVPEDSSLMRLATLLHYNRGTFVISDGGGSHRFTLRWPSTSRPRARACSGADVTCGKTAKSTSDEATAKPDVE
jgi:hypothetical protein